MKNSTNKKQRFRKKYTPESAKDRIEILKISLVNYLEEYVHWKNTEYSSCEHLILAMTHNTKESAMEEAERMIERVSEEIDYVRGFLYSRE